MVRDFFNLIYSNTYVLGSGSIMNVAQSPNGRLLVTCATDHTAKLWSIVSYMKDVEAVQNELKVGV